MRKCIMLVFIIACFISNATKLYGEDVMRDSIQYKIKIVVNDKILYATLENNPTSKDFVALLPLEIDLEDYHGIEKICYLPKKLSKNNAPVGHDPSIGDITYYAPWGNLAIFYNDFGYASGLIHLGKIEKGIELLDSSSALNARFELIE